MTNSTPTITVEAGSRKMQIAERLVDQLPEEIPPAEALDYLVGKFEQLTAAACISEEDAEALVPVLVAHIVVALVERFGAEAVPNITEIPSTLH